MKDPQLGEAIVFCDEHGSDHDALITAVWGSDCVNLIFVSSDESRKDNYGRQMERRTSVVHAKRSGIHGFYWRFKEEERNPIKAPLQT